ncbi:MAG: DCC1-like thiol-disulfide oxidoreductase family protein [Erythrobacter sp.]
MKMPPYSYRDDPRVPDFDDTKPLFIFDNVCVLCSSGVSFIMKHDKASNITFTCAQEELGQALCSHYNIDWDESYLFIRNGRAHIKSNGYFEVARALGGIWNLGLIFQIVPRFARDWAYDLIARNRYRWFGKTQACALLTPDQRARLL